MALGDAMRAVAHVTREPAVEMATALKGPVRFRDAVPRDDRPVESPEGFPKCIVAVPAPGVRASGWGGGGGRSGQSQSGWGLGGYWRLEMRLGLGMPLG